MALLATPDVGGDRFYTTVSQDYTGIIFPSILWLLRAGNISIGMRCCLYSYGCFDPDQMATLLGDTLAGLGNTVHDVPDRKNGALRALSVLVGGSQRFSS